MENGNWHDHVQVLEPYHLLYCRSCRTAVRPGRGIERHFRDGHGLRGSVLKEILLLYADSDLTDPTTAILPVDGSRLPEFPVLKGFSYNDYRFFTRAYDNVVRHRRTVGHANTNGWSEVSVQSWSRGGHARYWRAGLDGHTGSQGTEATSVFEQRIKSIEDILRAEETERLRKGDREENIDRDSSWVKRLQWVRHFGSRDLVTIHEKAQWIRRVSTNRPGPDDPASAEARILTRLGASFDREVVRCCARLDGVPTELLQALQSISAASLSGQPFRVKGQESSMDRYRSVGHRYLGFCWRAYQLGREEAEEQLAVQFTPEQWGLLGDMTREAETEPGSGPGAVHRRDRDRRGDDSDYESDSDSESTSSSDSGSGTSIEASMLDQAVFRFIIASIKQHVGGVVYISPLLSFCAALGIRRNPLGFAEPHLYTGLLAAILWWSRLFFVEDFFAGEPVDLGTVSPDAALRCREEIATWMYTGTLTPASTIIGWMAYGKGIRRTTAGRASVRWSDDRETLFQHGEAISVADFQRTARELIIEAEGTLDKLLRGQWQTWRRSIDMGRIADSMTPVGAGQSFATNERNRWLEPGSGKVIRLLGSQVWDAAEGRWKGRAVVKWMRVLRRFREQLLVMTHVWGGQPGRGPELMTMRHCDTWQLPRNVFVIDKAVLIVTDRDKMKAIRDNGHKVARMLNDSIGRMMVAYIAWLIPAEVALRRLAKLPAPREADMEYLWRDGPGRVWDTARATTLLSRAMLAGTGARLTIGRYRAVAIEMGRQVRGIVLRQLENRVEEEDEEAVEVDPVTGEAVDHSGSWNIVWDLQSTHGSKMARQHYAVHIGMPGQLQPELVATFREISRLWHRFLEGTGEAEKRKRGQLSVDIRPAPASRTATEGKSPKPVRLSHSGQVRPELPNQASLEAGWRASRTATATAGTSPKPVRLSNPGQVRPELPNQASLEAGWRASRTATATAGTSPKPVRLSNPGQVRPELPNQTSLEMGSRADDTSRDEAIEGGPPLLPTREAPDVARAESSNVVILGVRRGTEAIWSSSLPPTQPWTLPAGSQHSILEQEQEQTLQTGLESLLGAGAGWRSEKQGEAMRVIMGLRGDSSSIVVLPTGAGKSVLFMLPSVLRGGGSSIVVVPFVALVDDLVTRARDMGVDCIQYRSSTVTGREGPPRAARLVVVSADVVLTQEFTSYADGLVQAGLLERIFVDECHTVITDVGYRQRLEEVKGVRRFGVPVVMLTATLPVVLEGWFREAMLAGDAVMVRDRTVKLNCRYAVERVKPGPGAVEARVVALVGEMSARMSGDEKGVVYCRSKGQAEEVAEAIGCYAHHSGMEERAREDVRVRWADGMAGSRWIAATSGLGTGIDVGGVVAVIHAERPWGLVDFIQQTGRGGRRAGEVVQSVVVHDGRPGWARPTRGFVEEKNETAAQVYVEATGCRRAVISMFADGVDGETCRDVDGAEMCDHCEGGWPRGAVTSRGSSEGGCPRGAVTSQGSSEEGSEEGDKERDPTPAEPLWTRYGKEEGERVRVLLRWLDEAADGCPVCDVRDGMSGIRREERRQRHQKDRRCWEVVKGGYQEAVRKVRFGPLACCFRCKLPMDWCEERREEGGGCRDMDMVFPVAMAALRSVRIRELAEELGAEMGTTEAYLKWLGRDRRFHGLRGTNLLAVWEAVVWAAEGETGEW